MSERGGQPGTPAAGALAVGPLRLLPLGAAGVTGDPWGSLAARARAPSTPTREGLAPFPLDEPLVSWPLPPRGFLALLWEPLQPVIVLGAGRRSARDVDLAAARRAGVPLLRRRGGGGTVLLAPGMLVLSLTLSVRRRFANLHYTGLIHELISRGFRAAGLPEPRMRGISDLTFRERKVLGASLYRRRQRLLYQGVILVNAPVDTIAALLRHPDREPEYRRGRAHEEFLLNIRDLRPDATPRALAPALQRTLDAELPAVFAGELC